MIDFNEMETHLRYKVYDRYEYTNLEDIKEVNIDFEEIYDMLQKNIVSVSINLIINEDLHCSIGFHKYFNIPVSGYYYIIAWEVGEDCYGKQFSILAPQSPDDVEEYKLAFKDALNYEIYELLAYFETKYFPIENVKIISGVSNIIEIYFGKEEEK